MKKRLAAFIFAFLFLLSACGKTAPEPEAGTSEPEPETASEETAAEPEAPYEEPELLSGRELQKQALLATARAYYCHRSNIQYDQLMMDRIERKQPRYEFDVPEAATFQKDLYFECGVFCRNVYLTAFGYEPPKAGVILDPSYNNEAGERVFYWNGADEAAEDKEIAKATLKLTLQTGDIIYYNFVENNHVMLYIGDGEIMHCTCAAGGGDYDYAAAHDKTEPTALFLTTVEDVLAKRDIFNEKNKVCILRPFELGLTPTEDTLIRIKKLQDLLITKTTSAPKGVSVSPGGEVEITVTVRNLGKPARKLAVEDIAPEHTSIVSDEPMPWTLDIPGGESRRVKYTVKIDDDCPAGIIPFDNTRVEGMRINNTPIYVAKTLPQDKQDALKSLSVSALSATNEKDLIAEIYSKTLGLEIPAFEPADALSALFKNFNTEFNITAPDLDPASVFSKWYVLEMYGGQNCGTAGEGVRVRNVRNHNLIPGDIVLFSRDGKSGNAFVYLGDGEAAAIVSEKAVRADSAQLLDKLLGQFCFCVLRPSMG